MERPSQQRPRAPGIRDVARRAGVSVGTVSNVLNQPEVVTPDLRERVGRAIEELDFHPNYLAKSLRLRRTMTIGLVLSDITTPFAAEVAREVEDVASAVGMSVVFADSNERLEREQQAIRTLFDRGADGIILSPTAGDHSFLEAYLSRGWPIVCINRRPQGISVPWVLSDNAGGAAAATRHLLEHGHRRIGVVAWRREITTVLDRIEGYTSALAVAGIEPDPVLIARGDPSLKGGIEALRYLLGLRRPPTALITFTSVMTLGVIVALQERQLRVPREMALIGFDDALWNLAISPPVTGVALEAGSVGLHAARLLLDWIERKTPPSEPYPTVETTLVIRRSCGCPPSPASLGTSATHPSAEA